MADVYIADKIVTPRSQGGVICYQPGRLEVSGGKIKSISRISKKGVERLSKNTTRVKTIIPGFVDAHTHLVFAGDRSSEWNRRLKGESYQKIYKEGGGIRTSVRSTCEAKESVLLRLAKQRLKRMIRYGVTTVEIKSGYGLDLENEIKVLKVIRRLSEWSKTDVVSTFLGAHALREDYASTSSYIEYLIKEVIPIIGSMAEFQDVFCEKGYFSKAESIRLLQAGRRYGLKPKVHAHEFGRTGGVEAACEVGAVSADHLQFVNQADLIQMKKAGVIPVVLPGTSLFLGGCEFAPADKMWKAGLRVAIASDFNPGTNPSMNFTLAGTLAAIHEGLNLDQVLTAQTWHGALALDRKDRGVLERGKRADFLELDADRFEQIYYHYGDNLVRSVYAQGKRVA